MRLATSTNIMQQIPGREEAGVRECLKRCHAAGFRVFDLNCCDRSGPGQYMRSADWEAETYRIKALCETLDLEFSQCHLEYYNVCDPAVPDREVREEMGRRGILACEILGIKWSVIHPGSVYEGGSLSREKSKAANIAYFTKWLDFAAEHGVGLALENIFDWEGRRHYAGAVEDLIDLTDSLKRPNAGICWDFGHAHMYGYDHVYWLKRIGKRLKALHVQDTHGEGDDHLAPFYGTIPWPPIMKTLKEIGFCHDLAFEIHLMTRNMPDALRESQLRHLCDIGHYLIKLYEEA